MGAVTALGTALVVANLALGTLAIARQGRAAP